MAADSEERTTTGYDRWAPSYDDGDPTTWLDEPFVVRHLRPFPGCRILDMGAGPAGICGGWPPASLA
jgi:hypothetical protein